MFMWNALCGLDYGQVHAYVGMGRVLGILLMMGGDTTKVGRGHDWWYMMMRNRYIVVNVVREARRDSKRRARGVRVKFPGGERCQPHRRKQ